MSKQYARLIAPPWLCKQNNRERWVIEGLFTEDEIVDRNVQGFNVYYLPNYPNNYQSGTVDGTQIDTWDYVFVDYDCKSNAYPDKDSFISSAVTLMPIEPTRIVDSGNGIHVYWKVSDLDAMSFLRLGRRLCRLLHTDDAVQKVFQLMRLPGTVNTKVQDDFKLCDILLDTTATYTCEELDKLLPPITVEDEAYCQQHYDKTYNVERKNVEFDDTLPPKFGKLLRENHEAKAIWAGNTDDRSKDDYRLGHLMFANDFSREEAISVLVNSAKAMSRAPVHRLGYATNIVEKIWTFESGGTDLKLSSSVEDILKRSGKDTVKGIRFRCKKWVDNTVHGFRLGQVLGLVAGSGVGKTAFALNMFRWFAQENPDYHHFFIPLEQPANEIADRWATMCQGDTTLHKKVHVLSNYDDNGQFRHLSLSDIQEYIEKWQQTTGLKVGCVVIDHIGALKKKGSNDENQDLMTICHSMKAFAVQTNTFLIMQSQTSREKAGIGDLELNKDAAYGTLFFESYCDWLLTLWQPLKRCHMEQACPTVTAFKFCKIRHKRAKHDAIQEDVPYYLYFDSELEQLKDMTQDQETSFNYFISKAVNKRKADRKTEILEYKSVPIETAKTNSN